MLDLQNCCSEVEIYPQCHDASFYPLLVSFHLQITYRKVRNLQIGVNKLLGKVSINLLHHVKFITSAQCRQADVNQHLHNTNVIIIWCLHKVCQENNTKIILCS